MKRSNPITVQINGNRHRYDSESEMWYACYLEVLRLQGHIKSWEPEPIRFDFHEHNYRNRPREYTPDFGVVEADGTYVYIEYKGWLQTMDLSRIRRAWDHYTNDDGSDLIFDLVVPRFSNGKGSQLLAKAQCDHRIRRVIDARTTIGRIPKATLFAVAEWADRPMCRMGY
jgi:hypothetical protein